MFFSFARNTDKFFAKVDVLQVDIHKLAYANAGSVKKLDDRPISAAKIGVDVRRFDKTDRILDRKVVGQLAFNFWRRHQLGRICFDHSFANQELEKRP